MHGFKKAVILQFHYSWMKRILFLISIMGVIFACATQNSVSHHYSELKEEKNIDSFYSKHTTIFFLVDGLSYRTLKKEIGSHHLPHIEKHFLKEKNSFYEAYSIFPTLTFPNIAGLLTEKPVHLSGAYGNSLLYKSETIHFESIFDRMRFAKRIKGNTIFMRLENKNQKTVSLDYGLGTDATISTELEDIKSGLAVGFKDYLYLDEKRIESLQNILSNTNPSEWPSFIFIHLIGIDFLSHQYGQDSEIVQKYIMDLDNRLKNVFQVMQKSESKNHQIISILSADHGFASTIKHRIKIEDYIYRYDPHALILNEGRMAGIYTKTSLSYMKEQVLKLHKIDMVAYLEKNQLVIQSKNLRVALNLEDSLVCYPTSKSISIAFKKPICPEALDLLSQNLFYPHLIPNLIYYFQALDHPDLIIIPNKETTFQMNEIGFHGGPTPEETRIPLLLRNATLPKHQKPLAIWQLLQFL